MKRIKNSKNIHYSFIISTVSLISIIVLSFLVIFIVSSNVSEETMQTNLLPETGESNNYRAFVTSKEYDGILDSKEDYSSVCSYLGNLPGSSDNSYWVAWLSTPSRSVKDKIRDLKYVLMNNSTVIAYNKTDLIDGKLGSPINMDESQNIVNDAVVWTGTSQNGIGTSSNCSNWTSSNQSLKATYGLSSSTDSTWTSKDLKTCDNKARLYCFEVLKDRDNDGFYETAPDITNSLAVDCNDYSSFSFPGASEVCDGKDNDCDGQIDENLTQVCAPSVGICSESVQSCSNGVWGSCARNVGPAPETCDGLDNDCDRIVDDSVSRSCGTDVGNCTYGNEVCKNGNWGKCSGVGSSEEICDGIDNDCDGELDEGCTCAAGETKACGKDTGECQSGIQTCQVVTWGTCEGAVGPKTEICDGKDNDCDGNVDEELQKKCGSEIGECDTGLQVCQNGVWSSCEGGILPQNEICDSLDNDCNNIVDEGCSCPEGETRICGINKGECKEGEQTCTNGVWGDCKKGVNPEDEVCDNLDNNCDGETDEGYVCEEIEVTQTTTMVVEIEETEENEKINWVKLLIPIVVTMFIGAGIITYVKLKSKGIKLPKIKIKTPKKEKPFKFEKESQKAVPLERRKSPLS